jgi:hypothetical protein
MAKDTGTHRWRFFRAGNVDQARIETGADVLGLGDLDMKIWVALACPVRGLEFDERTLALLDTDGDGRIRAPEIQAAAAWACRVLKDPELMIRAPEALRLEWIDDGTPEGAHLLATARRILNGHGKDDAGEVTILDATEAGGVLAKSRMNGDGIQSPAAIDEPVLKALATDILATLGGAAGADGEAGVTKAALDTFLQTAAAYMAWLDKAGPDVKDVHRLGEDTVAAADALRAVRAKIDDYFTRCRLAAFDPRAGTAMNRPEEDWKALAAKDLTPTSPEVAAFPLARIEPDRALPLSDGVNPAWAATIAAFRDRVVEPLLGKGRTSLTLADWHRVTAEFAAYETWQAQKVGAILEPLGAPRVREILASDAGAGLAALIAADAAVAPQMKAIVDVERLVRYVRDLNLLLNNYVSFTDFYARRKAVFQAGTLFIDGRACDLCLRVDDPGRHGTMASLARMYLLYCDCTRPSGERMSIVAAITNGDSDNLMVGRNGVFYDRKGRDWDATVTKIVENPISLRQAFWSPYKKFLRMVEEQVAKRAAVAEAASEARVVGAAQATVGADKAKPPTEPKKIDIGTVAALGVAVGGITAAMGMLLQSFFGLGMWMPLGILGLVLLISGPSLLIAWLKLRKRNLGPILDANGWAVNALTRVNIPFGAALTSLGQLPPGAERSMSDPYAEKQSVWPRLLLIALILAGIAFGLHKTGVIGRWLESGPTPTEVAPAPDQ